MWNLNKEEIAEFQPQWKKGRMWKKRSSLLNFQQSLTHIFSMLLFIQRENIEYCVQQHSASYSYSYLHLGSCPVKCWTQQLEELKVKSLDQGHIAATERLGECFFLHFIFQQIWWFRISGGQSVAVPLRPHSEMLPNIIQSTGQFWHSYTLHTLD